MPLPGLLVSPCTYGWRSTVFGSLFYVSSKCSEFDGELNIPPPPSPTPPDPSCPHAAGVGAQNYTETQ